MGNTTYVDRWHGSPSNVRCLDRREIRKMKIKEEIGRNYHTADTDPIPYDYDDNIDVQTRPIVGDDKREQRWEVKINCKSHPQYSVPAQVFPDETQADHYSRQQVDAIKSKIMNESVLRSYVRNYFLDNLL